MLASRMSGAASAAWVLNGKVEQDEWIRVKRASQQDHIRRNHTSTITVWMTRKCQLPMNTVTRSAMRAPKGAVSDSTWFTGC